MGDVPVAFIPRFVAFHAHEICHYQSFIKYVNALYYTVGRRSALQFQIRSFRFTFGFEYENRSVSGV
jgi:hypothetical protein